MTTAALTFRAEPEFLAALKTYADGLGVCVNSAIKEILAQVIGVFRRTRTEPSFMKFAGCLGKAEADRMLEFNRSATFSKIDEEMWK